MISFIYFDVGGTLLDWSNVFETTARKFSLDPEDIGRVFDEHHDEITKGLMTSGELWERCIQKYNLKNASDYNFVEAWVSDYRPIREIHKLIYKITPRYKTGLLSNIYEGMLPLMLDKGIIPDIHYAQIIFSCDVGMMKPESNIYALAQEKAQVETREILLVDDKEENLDRPRELGWNTFFFNNRQVKSSVEELEKYLSQSGFE